MTGIALAMISTPIGDENAVVDTLENQTHLALKTSGTFGFPDMSLHQPSLKPSDFDVDMADTEVEHVELAGSETSLDTMGKTETLTPAADDVSNTKKISPVETRKVAKQKTPANATPTNIPNRQTIGKQASLTLDKLKPVQPHARAIPSRPKPRSISGTAEIRFDDSRRIKQWGDIYYGLLSQTNELKHCVNYTSTCQNSQLMTWADQIRPLKNLNKKEQVQQINNMVNKQGYQRDSARYQTADYWATPSEFLNSRGDCEDYAILKLASLMALGHSNSDLRLVVGKITGVGSHAFLSVNLQNAEYLLDNRTNFMSNAASRNDFIPKHSMNFSHRWLHMPKANKTRSI